MATKIPGFGQYYSTDKDQDFLWQLNSEFKQDNVVFIRGANVKKPSPMYKKTKLGKKYLVIVKQFFQCQVVITFGYFRKTLPK